MSSPTPRFLRLFERERERVYATCLGMLGSRAEAEDATQSVFLRVLESLGDVREEAATRTWVLRIAVHYCLRVRRRSRLFKASAEAPELPGTGPSPETAFESRERAWRLSRALSALSEEQLTVLTLSCVEGLSHAEIAEVLRVPVGTIWSRLSLARKKLLALVDEKSGRFPKAT